MPRLHDASTRPPRGSGDLLLGLGAMLWLTAFALGFAAHHEYRGVAGCVAVIVLLGSVSLVRAVRGARCGCASCERRRG